MVKIRESEVLKAGGRVVLMFVLTQHSYPCLPRFPFGFQKENKSYGGEGGGVRDEQLMKNLVYFFGCGQSYSYKDYAEFKCSSFQDNYEKNLTFFRKYPIRRCPKSQDFEDWGKVAEIIKTKASLTKEGLENTSSGEE
jgi:hypothetical protein